MGRKLVLKSGSKTGQGEKEMGRTWEGGTVRRKWKRKLMPEKCEMNMTK